MVSRKRILSLTVVLVFGVLSAFAAQNSAGKAAAASKSKSSSKTAVPKNHVAQGSVVATTNDTLTVLSGKKDMVFKLDSSTQKPASITPGSSVKINYHDEGIQHIASSVELMAAKSSATAAKPPASK